MAKKKEKLAIIEGVVSPRIGNEEDIVPSIVIVTDDGEEYYVEPEEQEAALADFMDKNVEVQGKIRTSQGIQYIDVVSYEVIPDDDDDNDDE